MGLLGGVGRLYVVLVFVAVVDVEELVVRYGDFMVVWGTSWLAQVGVVMVLFGLNGVGKIFIVEVFEGYRSRVIGSVRVLGFDFEI